MGRLVKCQYCEDKVDKDVAYIYKKRNYHEECFRKWEQEHQDYESLKKYICEIYRLDYVTGLMLKQIKNFKEENQYKYKGMELALRYFYETLGNKAREGDGIGIIPYVYEDAKKDYLMKINIQEKVDEMNVELSPKKTITIKSQPLNFKSKVSKFDISSL